MTQARSTSRSHFLHFVNGLLLRPLLLPCPADYSTQTTLPTGTRTKGRHRPSTLSIAVPRPVFRYTTHWKLFPVRNLNVSCSVEISTLPLAPRSSTQPPLPPSQAYKNVPNVFESLEDMTAATFEARRPPSLLLSPSFMSSLPPHAPYHRFFGHANLNERLLTPPLAERSNLWSGPGAPYEA